MDNFNFKELIEKFQKTSENFVKITTVHENEEYKNSAEYNKARLEFLETEEEIVNLMKTFEKEYHLK